MMLTRQEKNQLLWLLSQLDEAWRDYVRDVADDKQSRFGAGAVVVERHEDLKKYITDGLA